MYLSLACSGVGCFLTETTTNSQERVTLVTDSSACLPVHEVAANPIVVLPAPINPTNTSMRLGLDFIVIVLGLDICSNINLAGGGFQEGALRSNLQNIES